MRYLLFLSLLFSTTTFAKVTSDEQVWANFNSFISTSSPWQFYLEFQPRAVDYQLRHGTSLYRGAVGRSLSPELSAWLGYAFIERTDPSYLHEDRPFLQLIHSKALSDEFRLINRSRFEARLFRGESDTSYRLRHLLRGQYMFGGSLGVAISDEWFWNANTIASPLHLREGFDQNRFFIGPMILFGDKRQHLFEVGYLNHYVNGKAADLSNHNLSLQLTLRF